MNATTLKQNSETIQLLDVRLADDFEAAHLVGAVSNCVYEVAFADRLADTAPDPARLTVIYGADGNSLEAVMASEKLGRLGYSRVEILEGGFAEARNTLTVVKGQRLSDPPPGPDGTYEIDLQQSKVEWTGRNLLNKHYGTIAINSGELRFRAGELVGGTVTLDPSQLHCNDLEGEMHDLLIQHLLSHDFFDIECFPEMRVEISGASQDEIEAELTIKSQTHPIRFPIASGLTAEGLPAAQATLAIDRTRWGVLYGSKKLFHRLAGHLVNDQIEIDLRIVTKK